MGRLERSGVDIRRLRYFVAVCDHGGFSKAANVTGIAQPALTRQVQLLEQELGLPLFTRNGRGAVPTEPGVYLLTHARAHLDGLDVLIDRMRRNFGNGPTSVTLGICPTIAPLFLGSLRESLRQHCPLLSLSVIEAYSGDLRNLMAVGRLDIALSYFPTEDCDVHATELLSERLVLVSTRTPTTESLTLSDAAGMRLILPSRIHQLRRIIDSVAAAHQISLTPALELGSLNAVKAMVEDKHGGYATILPYNSVDEDAEHGRFAIRHFDEPEMIRTIALLRPAAGARPLPPVLTEHIWARAKEIRNTLTAVH
jgi:LysR family transcriptional regulator, nitrogen assimilation regulatory protein